MVLRVGEKEAGYALEKWLEKRGISSNWHPGKNPPDLCFHVNSKQPKQRWAVEVTRLFQYVDSRATQSVRVWFFALAHKHRPARRRTWFFEKCGKRFRHQASRATRMVIYCPSSVMFAVSPEAIVIGLPFARYGLRISGRSRSHSFWSAIAMYLPGGAGRGANVASLSLSSRRNN
jgi:hypothetical protein